MSWHRFMTGLVMPRSIFLNNPTMHTVTIVYAASSTVTKVASVGKPGLFELKFIQVCSHPGASRASR